ncbi:MAG: SHOCT domain-containing protein, partial [Nitrosopumilaceae archaeon]
TGFVVNKTNSVWKTFDFSLDGSPVIHPTSQPAPIPQPTSTPQPTQQSSQSDEENENESDDELTIQEKIKERIEAAQKQKEAQANPPPQTESGSTADQTTTGESTTTSGDTTVTGDKSGTTGISTPIDLGSNMLYVVIGLGGAGAIAGVVYGIKNKNRHNQDDKPVVKIREPSVKSTPSEDDYALMILKNRLAKGEITIDEFNALKEALKEP